MNRALRMIGLAAAIAAPTLLAAQSSSNSKPISFGISGGASLPMGDLGDAAESGFVVAGHVFLKPSSMTNARFRGDVGYDKWGSKGSSNADLRSLSFVANAMYDFPSSSMVRPYLIGGVGLYNTKVTFDLGTTTGSTKGETNVGINVGGGLTFKMTGFDTFVEAKYTNVFADNSSSWIPISFGVRF